MALVRRASVPAIVKIYADLVSPRRPLGRGVTAEVAGFQRWVGMCVHAELFRRGRTDALEAASSGLET